MPLFTVDPDKCKRDGICAAECPMAIIAMPDKDAPPVPAPNAEENCIRCGHCVAVCPHGALSLKFMPVEDCPPVNREWALSPAQAEHFLRSRRSVRRFKDRAVDREIIEELLRIASCAPSGHNSQPVEWMAVMDREKVHELAGHTVDWMRHMLKVEREFAKSLHMDMIVAAWRLKMDVVMRGAPHLVVAHAPADSRPGPIACHIALAYAELAAPPLSVGTCWAGFFQAAANVWTPLKEALGLPPGHEVHGGLMVGKPKFQYHRMPARNPPKITWA